ncbi:MAG: hypothetical protein ACPGH0_05245, partial [Opitutales bacterium]
SETSCSEGSAVTQVVCDEGLLDGVGIIGTVDNIVAFVLNVNLSGNRTSVEEEVELDLIDTNLAILIVGVRIGHIHETFH